MLSLWEEKKGREPGIVRQFNLQSSIFAARLKQERLFHIRANATTQLPSNNDSLTIQGIGLEPRIPTEINRTNGTTARWHPLRSDSVRGPEIVCRNHNNIPVHTSMKADTIDSASGVRKPYSTDPNRSPHKQFHQTSRYTPGTFADLKGQPKVDPIAELVAKANRDASYAAEKCKIIGNLTVFSSKLRQSTTLMQRLRPERGSFPLYNIF